MPKTTCHIRTRSRPFGAATLAMTLSTVGLERQSAWVARRMWFEMKIDDGPWKIVR